MSEHSAPASSVILPPLSITDFPALKAHLKQTLTGPTILGSQLGDLLLKASTVIERQIHLRNFGGLRKFASEHLNDLVALKAQHAVGQAEIYEVLIETTTAGTSSTVRQPLAFTPRNARYFWYAISNPLSRYAAAVSEGKIVCYVRSELGNGATIFPSFPLDDYRELANDFVLSLPLPSREKAVHLLSEVGNDDLHKKWVSFLRQECGVPTVQKWDGVRASAILKTFVERALQAGLPPAEVESYRILLSTVNLKPSGQAVSARNEPRSLDLKKAAESRQVKALAIEIINKMSDDQIRGLNFPFGLMLDATKFH
jgi:hypothetical protein